MSELKTAILDVLYEYDEDIEKVYELFEENDFSYEDGFFILNDGFDALNSKLDRIKNLLEED